jgi:hypothetical protein
MLAVLVCFLCSCLVATHAAIAAGVLSGYSTFDGPTAGHRTAEYSQFRDTGSSVPVKGSPRFPATFQTDSERCRERAFGSDFST